MKLSVKGPFLPHQPFLLKPALGAGLNLFLADHGDSCSKKALQLPFLAPKLLNEQQPSVSKVDWKATRINIINISC